MLFAGLLALLLALCAAAQTPDAAVLTGRVLDPSRQPVRDAHVVLTNAALGWQRETRTDAAGSFTFAALPVAGLDSLRVKAPGFQPVLRTLTLAAGSTQHLDLLLSLTGKTTSIVVTETNAAIQTEMPEPGIRLSTRDVNTIPLLSRNLSALPLLNSANVPTTGTGDLFLGNTLFVANGAGRRQTSFVLDGATANDDWGRQTIFTNVPLTAIQDFHVLNNTVSAQYGFTSGNVVSIVTRSGEQHDHGEILELWRPAATEARSPLAARATPSRLSQTAWSLSGPIVRNNTQFFLSAEADSDHQDSAYSTPLAQGIYPGVNHRGLALGRLDHQFNPDHLLFLRFDADRMVDTNPGGAVGGLVLPGAGRIFQRNTYSAELGLTDLLSPALISQFRLQYQLGSPITRFRPVDFSTQYVWPGVATEGESRAADLMNHQDQAGETVSWNHGAHRIQFGGDLVVSSSGGDSKEFGGGFVLGQFVLRPGDITSVRQLTPADVQRYTQSFGNAHYRVEENLWSGFVQDDVRVRPDLLLQLGLRYERQTFTNDGNNLAPRLGFAWTPEWAKSAVLHGSYGIFYSEIPADTAADFTIGGPQGVYSFSVAPGQYGFPANLQPLAAFPAGANLPPRDINIRPGEAAYLSQFFNISKLRGYPSRLLNPSTRQWNLGLERTIARSWQLRLDYVGSHTLDINRPLDLNAPAPFLRTQPGQVRSAAAADITRPIVPTVNGYRRIVSLINDGSAWYSGLQVNVTHTFSHSFALLASYTWSHALDTVEPDVPSQDPNDANFTGAMEKASSLLDQRQRAVLTGWWTGPGHLSVGAVVSLASGLPYSLTTGADNNGDGSFADRPIINGILVPRNSGRGTATYDFAPFVQRPFDLLAGRLHLTFRAEAFNLLNHSNFTGFNGTYGNASDGTPLPTLGQPLGGTKNVQPARELQFMVRLNF